MTPNAEVSNEGNKLKYSQISYFMRYKQTENVKGTVRKFSTLHVAQNHA